VFYIDFPSGRLKFFGTLVFPKNKYMVLKLGNTDSVLCEDVFETMVRPQPWWAWGKGGHALATTMHAACTMWQVAAHTHFTEHMWHVTAHIQLSLTTHTVTNMHHLACAF
jgi:hypothetical protein